MQRDLTKYKPISALALSFPRFDPRRDSGSTRSYQRLHVFADPAGCFVQGLFITGQEVVYYICIYIYTTLHVAEKSWDLFDVECHGLGDYGVLCIITTDLYIHVCLETSLNARH